MIKKTKNLMIKLFLFANFVCVLNFQLNKIYLKKKKIENTLNLNMQRAADES